MSERFNIASLLEQRARAAPERVALIVPDGARAWKRRTYRELQANVERTAHALARAGLRREDRVCVFVKPGLEWVEIVYALFRLGALPVLIDLAMGRAGLLACVERIGPRGFIGVPLALALKLAAPRAFATVEVALTVGRLPLGGRTLASLRSSGDATFEAAPTSADDKAAILFTSGSTGPAKGVAYTHGMFRAQVAALGELYAMREGDVDLACFAPFALFGPALGLTTVLPRIDFSHPARCAPAEVVRALREHRAVQSFGSPAIWRRVAPWCAERGIVLPDLKRLMIAGAPVPLRLIEPCLALLPPDGDVFTPYGATEALPVASIGGRELLARHRHAVESGAGNCVGRLAPACEARVIRITDEPIETWSDALLAPPGEPGELVVRGPQVTREYEREPAHTAAAKINDGASVWHRMGDVARIDGEGLLWFLGRKSHRLETARGTLLPGGIENIFDLHEAVARSALVGVGPRGAERPFLVVEPLASRRPKSATQRRELAADILRVSLWFPICTRVEDVLFCDALPVDARHNAKIDRLALKRWAEERVK